MSRVLLGLAVAVAGLLSLPIAAALTLTAVSVPGTLPGAPHVGQPIGSDTVPSGAAGAVLAWADSHAGDRYRMGATGPHQWDCSSFVQAAWARAGVHLPRIAQDQRNWLAAGHGTRIAPGREQPGDLVFWDSYLGPRTIGHVVLVHDPARHTTIEARSTRLGVGHFTYQPRHYRYEIWRPLLERRP